MAFMVSQIKVLKSEDEVNKWLKQNYHVEVLNVTMSSRGEAFYGKDQFVIHYKIRGALVE